MGEPDKQDEAGLLDAVYGAALGEHDWSRVLEQLRQDTGAAMVALLSQDKQTSLPIMNAAASHDAGWAQTLMERYRDEFFIHDPTPAAVHGWQAGRWFRDEHSFSPDMRARSIYYQEFLQPMHLGCWSGTYLVNTDEFQIFISLQRHGDDQRSGPVQDASLTSHMARALRVASRLGDLQRRAAVAESTLDELDTPVMLLDAERGRLLLANARAQAMMRTEPALCFVNERFAPSGQFDAAFWRAVCRAGGCALTGAGGARLAVTLAPVPGTSRLAQHWQRPLVLMTLAGARTAAHRVERLRQRYTLTQAEAEVAVTLACDELSPTQCADARAVSVGTVRAQIKSIQLKMGVSRLAQVVSLVLML